MKFIQLKSSVLLGVAASVVFCHENSTTSQTNSNDSTEMEFNILYMNSFFEYDVGAGLVQLAKKAILEDQLLPADSQINIQYENCTCCVDSGKGYPTVLLTDYITKLRSEGRRLHAVMGPGCSDRLSYISDQRRMISMAHVAAQLNLPVFSYIATAAELNNRALFKTFIRTSATGATFAKAVTLTVKHFGWRKLGILTLSSSALSLSVTDKILQAGANREIDVTANDRVALTDTDEDLDRKTAEFKDNSRIILLNTGSLCDNMTLRMLESLARNGMNNNEYVFIIYQLYLPYSAGAYDAQCVQSNKNDMLLNTMWPKVMEIHHDFGEVPDLEKIYNDNNIDYTDGSIQYPGWAIALHDAFYLWAVAVNRTMMKTNNYNQTLNGTAMLSQCTNIAVQGLMGSYYMDASAELVSSYVVRTVKQDGTYFDVLKLKAELQGDKTIFKEIDLATNFWASGLPNDTPTCGFRGCPLLATDTVLWICACATGAILLASVAIMLYIRRLKQAKFKEMPWKVEPSEPIPLDSQQAKDFNGSMLSMNKSRRTSLSVDLEIEIESIAMKRRLCRLRGEYVLVRRVHKFKKFSTRDDLLLIHLYDMYNLRADNIATFLGIADDPQIAAVDVLFLHCNRGTLKSVLGNKELSLDNVFRASFARDVMKGLSAIHMSPIKCHGQLNIYNCVVSTNWTVKLTGFGLNPVAHVLFDNRPPEKKSDQSKIVCDSELLYVAPELLIEQHLIEHPIKGTVAGDIFALGLLLYELIEQESPFALDYRQMSPQDVIMKVKSREYPTTAVLKHTGKMTENSGISALVADTIREAANPLADDRPPLKLITRQMNKYLPKGSDSIVGHMMQLMEKYAKNLEKLVHERTAQLEQSQMRADQLLYQMLPRTVADTLKSGQNVPPVTYRSVTVCFCDIVGFTYMCSMSSPMQIVDMLNNCFKQYDAIIAEQGVFKVETIGDAYMMACGLFEPPGTNHTAIIANTILAMSELTSSLHIEHIPEMKMTIRAGFHTGAVAAGVIGLQAPRYCLFGDTVNTASRMESTGEPGRVQITESACKMIESEMEFDLKPRGRIQIKGKGEMSTYWLSWSPDR